MIRPPPAARRAVVIGGGAAGIAAARRLTAASVQVTLLEAAPQLGGCVRTVEFAGTRVAAGAEALHTASPGPLKLVAELGLGDHVVAAGAGPTWIAVDGRLRRLPAGVGPAGPTRLRPLLGARLLTPAGMLRAALEPLMPQTTLDRDRAVGDVLQQRFGREVVDRIVDPLLGGLHAGDVRRLSLEAATPMLAGLLHRHRSVLLARRGRTPAAPHGFVTLHGGLDRLFTAAGDQFTGDLRLSTEARAIIEVRMPAGRYRVETNAEALPADIVVVAVPPRPAERLLPRLAPGTSPILRRMRAASVSVALLAYPAAFAGLPALAGTGILVPSSAQRLLKAATFLSTKWPHLSSPHVLVRASAGRADDPRAGHLDDDELVLHLTRDLEALVGLPGAPIDHRVVRWQHAMPQLEVGHRGRLSDLRAALPPGVSVAGAAYDGVGIASALRSGEAAADAALSHLTGSPT